MIRFRCPACQLVQVADPPGPGAAARCAGCGREVFLRVTAPPIPAGSTPPRRPAFGSAAQAPPAAPPPDPPPRPTPAATAPPPPRPAAQPAPPPAARPAAIRLAEPDDEDDRPAPRRRPRRRTRRSNTGWADGLTARVAGSGCSSSG